MSFFDSKEEVLNLQLTERGRYLLSKGIFQPKYYGFFDDDILYDIQYAGAQEKQNDIQERIINGTPSLKPQVNFSSVLTKMEKPEIVDSSGNSRDNNIFTNKDGLQNSLGTSDYNSDYAPAWSINIFSGQISSSMSAADLKNPLNVTQIDMSDAQRVYYKKSASEDITNITDEMILETDEEYQFLKEINMLNTVEVIEKNCTDKLKNFNIEIFIEEDENWKQLNFLKNKTNIIENLLLDDAIDLSENDIDINENNVEYYFDIALDNEVQIEKNMQQQSIDEIYADTNPFPGIGNKCNG